MKIEKTPNGNLKIIAEPQDAEMLSDLKDICGDNDKMFMDELLETTGWNGNSVLNQVSPEDIGALTDAPIVTDDMTIEDDGTVTVNGNVWWFPNYMVENFAETLIRNGSVVFEIEKARPQSFDKWNIGAKLVSITEVNVGDFLFHTSKRFNNAKNMCRVTKKDEERGVLHAIFVNCDTGEDGRPGSGDSLTDHFAIWDFVLSDGEYQCAQPKFDVQSSSDNETQRDDLVIERQRG